jgi:cytochrome c oxidase cbb3-type subunit III
MAKRKDPTMSDEDRNETLMSHEADGIKELDNLLPRWWVWLFHLTIIFSVGYMLYYHVFSMGDLQAAAYEREWERGEAIKKKAISEFEATIGGLDVSTDTSVLADGLEVYTLYCAPCHRPDGGGLVGPNLCDDYWIHGSNYTDNIKIIVNGVPEKGMITWRGILRPSQIQSVASYIHKFRGTTPPNPKPPENQAPVDTGPSMFE